MNLRELGIGKFGRIIEVGGSGSLRRHFLDMGLIQGAIVKIVKYAPMGDPVEISLYGYSLTLRLADAEKITIQELSRDEVSDIEKQDTELPQLIANQVQHPGLGEEGKYHDTSQKSLPAETILSFALVGNQNCGKTTLFNHLTGSNQHVGNFPGVTVSRKDGRIKQHKNTVITDLPGIYSMSPYTAEEIVSREFILNENPKCIINIVDATNVMRSLNLTIQLMELSKPMVLALNMMDEVKNNGGTIRINKMEELLGIPIIPISAAKNEGIDELVHHAIHVAKYQEKPKRHDFCDATYNNGAVHRAIHSIIHLIEDHAEKANLPTQFTASKIIEGDELIISKLNLDENELEMLEHIVCQMEKECNLDRVAAIADMRYSFIRKLCHQTVKQPKESKERRRSIKFDTIFTGKFTALPSFIAIMGLVFYLTFGLIGPFLQDLLDDGINKISDLLSNWMIQKGVNETIQNLVTDGIFSGVGCVLSFLPIVVTLFFFLSLLEDSGYIARVAFFMDRLLRKIGLSGRSIVPMLIGFGCTVPAVMATRTLPSARDRKLTILLTPFMSCTAKLPVYAFFVNAFFPVNYRALIITGLYFLGIFCGILMAVISKKTLFRGEAVPFVMELPNYRLPGIKNVSQLLWEKTKDFLQRAFTIIFVASIAIWFLQSFNLHLQVVSEQQESILASIASFLIPVFKPLALGDWRICVSLITGFIAKESVISTLQVLFHGEIAVQQVLSKVSVTALLVFSLLYTPCVAAIAAIRKELGWKYSTAVIIWQCLLAWIVAYLAKIIAGMFL